MVQIFPPVFHPYFPIRAERGTRNLTYIANRESYKLINKSQITDLKKYSVHSCTEFQTSFLILIKVLFQQTIQLKFSDYSDWDFYGISNLSFVASEINILFLQ